MGGGRCKRVITPHTGGAADEAGGDQGELVVAPSDVWMSCGGGAGRAGDDGRRNSLGQRQSENATLRKIEARAQMEVSEWRTVEMIV